MLQLKMVFPLIHWWLIPMTLQRPIFEDNLVAPKGAGRRSEGSRRSVRRYPDEMAENDVKAKGLALQCNVDNLTFSGSVAKHFQPLTNFLPPSPG